ncbi:MAG: acyltransferase [Leptospira sp.]|nr:acyltransferase [Leptospira sp.]
MEKLLNINSNSIKVSNYKWILLGLGAILLGFTGMRWNIPIFAWVALVPFLRYIRLDYSFWVLLVSLIFIQTISTFRIVSEPFHAFIALSSGIQGGIVFSLLLWIQNWIRKKTNDSYWNVFCFAFLFAIMEWLGGISSEFGVWGMMANSQLSNLVLLQSASILGATGLSFIIYWSNVLIERTWFELETTQSLSKHLKYHLILFMGVLVGLYMYGAIRLTLPIQGETLKFATVTSQKDIQSFWNHPLENQANTDLVISRTIQAAKEGAKVVVWNEGGVLVQKNDENSFLQRIQILASEQKIEIIAAIVIPLKPGEFFMENKIHWISNTGEIRQTYFKQFIPPGEPISKVDSDVKVFDTPFGKLSAAICYDFDSLSLTKTHSDLGTGVTLIAASDWKGIDPFHTQMAILRGIENGTTIVRSTRGALSGIFDAYGRTRGSLEYYERNDGVLVASAPTKPIETIYRKYGNWIVGLGFLFLITFGIRSFLLRSGC